MAWKNKTMPDLTFNEYQEFSREELETLAKSEARVMLYPGLSHKDTGRPLTLLGWLARILRPGLLLNRLRKSPD